MAPAWAMSALLAVLVARLLSAAAAAACCAPALPPTPNSATRGSIAPARTMRA